MTPALGPRCACQHSQWRHVADTGRCRRPGCGCRTYADPVDAAVQRHPAGSRIPDHLTGSDRRGGGDPMADYRYLKGEL